MPHFWSMTFLFPEVEYVIAFVEGIFLASHILLPDCRGRSVEGRVQRSLVEGTSGRGCFPKPHRKQGRWLEIPVTKPKTASCLLKKNEGVMISLLIAWGSMTTSIWFAITKEGHSSERIFFEALKKKRMCPHLKLVYGIVETVAGLYGGPTMLVSLSMGLK